MKLQMNLLAAITMMGLGALSMGCYAETGTYVVTDTVAYDASPTLVSAGPGVWVVSGQPSTVYYADNYYWMYSGNSWYRSSYYNSGWASASVSVLPPTVVYHHSARYGGYSSPTVHHSPARPHVAHAPARPHVVGHANHPRVYTGQTHVGTHVVHSNPGPSFRSGGGASVHVHSPAHSVRVHHR